MSAIQATPRSRNLMTVDILRDVS